MVPLLGCCVTLGACETATVKATEVKPAHVEAIAGTELHKVTLTQRAAERLDIKTDRVQEMVIRGAKRKVVPYAAVLYDARGETWVYTSPEPLVFIRHRIHVDYISGDRAVLSQGPPAGTAVVTVGAAELFGAEFEIGH
ncbi:MAG TPA: hypothetical protein VGQ06_10130 [Gemmatimonadales bacterium]|nr:hypothetical protein [Gemmatimonadales bacterium]